MMESPTIMLGVFITLFYIWTMPNKHYSSKPTSLRYHLMAKRCLKVGRESRSEARRQKSESFAWCLESKGKRYPLKQVHIRGQHERSVRRSPWFRLGIYAQLVSAIGYISVQCPRTFIAAPQPSLLRKNNQRYDSELILI